MASGTDLPHEEEEDAAAVGTEQTLEQFSREKLDRTGRIIALIISDAIVVTVWAVISRGIRFVAEFFEERQGMHDGCLTLFHKWGPWFIFAIAILYLLRDVISELKKVVRDLRTGW